MFCFVAKELFELRGLPAFSINVVFNITRHDFNIIFILGMQKTEVMTLKSPPKPVDPVFMMKPNAGVVGVQTRSRIRHRLDRWAEQRKQRHEAYTDPTEMTWRRVSRTLDKILFRSFFIVVMAANIIVWAVMVTQYYTY